MNNRLVLLAAAVAVLTTAGTASAQNANFTGVRTEVHASVNDYQNVSSLNEIGYNAVIGVDAPLGDRWTVGAEVEAANVFDDEGRELGVGARLGYAASDTVLVFARAGYSHLDDVRNRSFDGASVGAGVQWNISERTHLTSQYRYTNYDQGADSNGVSVGIGYRF
jgi:opacity protein-like surface antigen